MKIKTITSIILSLIFFGSCQVHAPSRIGFKSEYNKDSDGLTIADVNHKAETICLEGIITRTAGAVEVQLINPYGEIIHSIQLHHPDRIEVNESFRAQPGLWKLRYKSIQGTGTLDIHLNIW